MEETRKIIKSFSPRPEYSPSSVYVPSAITTVALWHVFLPVLQFPLSGSFHQCSILIQLPPTLYNVLLPALQFPLLESFRQCSIFIHLLTTLYNLTKTRRFVSSTTWGVRVGASEMYCTLVHDYRVWFEFEPTMCKNTNQLVL